MHAPQTCTTLARAAACALLLSVLAACERNATTASAEPAAEPQMVGSVPAAYGTARHAATERLDLTAATLDAYLRGMEQEIALMRASGRSFVSLSRHDEEGRQVAAAAGLGLHDYTRVRDAVQKVLYERMLHERYAGADGNARLAGLEPHKRDHAKDVLARDPFASLSTSERDVMQQRLSDLRAQYDRYMALAAVGD